MRHDELIDKKIIYTNPETNRYGWKGEIVSTKGGLNVSRIGVRFENGVEEEYSVKAFEGVEGNYRSYLAIDDGTATINADKFWVIVAEHCVKNFKYHTEALAEEACRKFARESKSGQKYYVMEAKTYFQAPKPQVERHEV